MELIVILGTGIAGTLIGFKLMKRWYNHLTIYSIFWTLSLAFYALRFIGYYQISAEAWLYIGIGWFMLFLGSLVIIFAQAVKNQSGNSSEVKKNSNPCLSINLKILSKIIIVLSIASFLATIYTMLSIIRTFGSIGTAFLNANLVYSLRVEGQFSSIPYFSSLPLATCCLAGIYTALRRKITLLSVIPVILVIFHGIVIMGRTNIVIAAALFLTAFFYTPHKRFMNRKIVIAIILVTILALGGFTFISSVRGLRAYHNYETDEMENLRSTIIFLPSLYFYFSAPSVAFSEYLSIDEEKFFPGSYTFKPLMNILTKLNLAEPLPLFNQFIKTPEGINAATYLREIYADFGPLGVMIFPYVLGAILTLLYIQISYRPTATLIVILAHLVAVIWLSFDINIMKLGQWAVSILVSFIIALKLDSLTKEG